MRKNFGKKTAYVLLAALLAGTVSGCGGPYPGQAQGGNPEVKAADGSTGGAGAQEGSGNPAEAVSHGAGANADTAGDTGRRSGGTPAPQDAAAGTGMKGDSGPGNAGNGSENSNTGAAGGTNAAGNTDGNGLVSADISAESGEAVTDFGLRLLQSCAEAEAAFPPQASMPQDIYAQTGMGGNILVSPLSVISALAMTANGAAGETLGQMEDVMGMKVPELSAWLSVYREALPESGQYKLSMANGIWLTEDGRFTVEPAFLKANEDFFKAGVYRAPFDDSTLKEINGWVKENTDGMIDKILDEIPQDAAMYLVNALAFDAQWQEIYYDHQVREGEFTREDGRVQKAEMMYSEENAYLEDGYGAGFLKYYAEGKYAFAALLPKEGMPLQEYLASLDGAKLRGILENPLQIQVDAAIPKFESEYSIEMSKVLQSMGMTDAFDADTADFSGIGHSDAGNLYIGRVLHKTYAAVDERGTKAGAATAVEMREEGASLEEPVVMTVHLDRPFLYMIIDCESNVPVFIGMVETVG